MQDALRNKIASLPLTSGVYLMKDAAGQVIYIGKAVNLRRRVESYFRGRTHHAMLCRKRSGVPSVSQSEAGYGIKTALLVSHVADIDIFRTHSEAEALILEAALVKQHDPKYNIDLKDGKSYPYIQITKDKFPLVSVVRIPASAPASPAGGPGVATGIKAGKVFGPYTDAALIREALQLIRKIFPFRTCSPLADKVCLYHSIGLCGAPCVAKVTVEEYRWNIKHIALILEGRKDELYRDLKVRMEALSRTKDYEQAAKVRDQLRAVGALYSSSPAVNYFKEAEQLERALKLPRRPFRPLGPERIECIDISTTMGERPVGSLVAFHNGRPDKSNYRRFRIKEVKGIDDFKMIAEVVRRRYGRLKREGAAYPDLIVIDGGKGQLAAAVGELKKLEVEIPVVSLAKREEEIFVPGRRAAVVLSQDSLALKLLMRVRDEAHRFALSYHRLLRGKKAFE